MSESLASTPAEVARHPAHPGGDPVPQDGSAPVAVTTVTAHFKMVFLAVLVITIGTLAANLYIAIFVEKPTEAAKSAMDTCSTLTNLGFGAIVGLLGGKAVQ
ncbi:hypothetical protein AB0J13_20615 [Streptomyces anulatus]|uniref:hypothetical protein n=1 Tax=Streptomyces TaxID=1883 RepID=UPI00117FE723|nr:hypothetical protein [Streptomyces sp. or3]